jgi:Tfp pilus assembly protein PilF
MGIVEKILNKYKKRRPYLAFLIECVNGNYEQAENQLAFIKNESQKTIGLTIIYIQKKQLEQAKIENKKIKNDDIRHYNSALIALQEGDHETFQLAMSKQKSKATKYILMAEEAYKKGDFTEAERLGNLAISVTAGFKRFTLLKSLEREQKNPNRESYF